MGLQIPLISHLLDSELQDIPLYPIFALDLGGARTLPLGKVRDPTRALTICESTRVELIDLFVSSINT